MKGFKKSRREGTLWFRCPMSGNAAPDATNARMARVNRRFWGGQRLVGFRRNGRNNVPRAAEQPKLETVRDLTEKQMLQFHGA